MNNYLEFDLCRERDSNPHNPYGSRDFKSLVSTNSTIAAGLSSVLAAKKLCKGTLISCNLQTFLHYLRNNRALALIESLELIALFLQPFDAFG